MHDIQFQCYIPPRLAERIKQIASERRLSISALFRDLVHAEVARVDGYEPRPLTRTEREALYAMIGIDALLSAHENRELRGRALAAYRTQKAKREQGE